VRQLLAILASGDRRTLLQQIVAPTLVIHGSDDPLVPVAAGRDTARHIAASELEVIAGMGHDLPPAVQRLLVERIVHHCRRAQAQGDGGAGAAQAARDQPPSRW
jgi:proline iminopeptidase